METLPRPQLERLQLERLQRMAVYCYERVPFYHEKFDQAGFDPYKIKALSDLQYMPFTTKEDIRNHYPTGLFAVDRRQVVRIHASSGTTGKPTVVGYTRNDLDVWSECVARLCVAAGASDEDTAQICFGYGLFTGALGLHYGLERIGATVIPSSSGNTEKQLMLMKDLGTTTIISTPSYALYMAEEAQRLGYRKEDFQLRLGLFGSEGCTPEMRAKLEEAWGLFATDNYGMSELMGPGVSGECHLRCGLHVAEDHFIPEIIDPATGRRLEEGEEGELVVTTLTKEAFPMIRYRTKDISRLDFQPCDCGRTHVRMEKIIGRTDDMLKIRGVNVFPSQIESVLMTMPQVGGHYLLILRRERFTDSLEVKVELVDNTLLENYGALEALTHRIHDKLKSVLGLETTVTLADPQTLERTAGKAKRILDLRGN